MDNSRFIFRGKRVTNGEWMQGSLISNVFFIKESPVYYILDPDKYEDYDCWEDVTYMLDESEVIPETVGQCTGYRDKNGKYIFEGDTVRITSKGAVYTVVVDDKFKSTYQMISDYDPMEHEITGCIHGG